MGFPETMTALLNFKRSPHKLSLLSLSLSKTMWHTGFGQLALRRVLPAPEHMQQAALSLGQPRPISRLVRTIASHTEALFLAQVPLTLLGRHGPFTAPLIDLVNHHRGLSSHLPAQSGAHGGMRRTYLAASLRAGQMCASRHVKSKLTYLQHFHLFTEA